MHISDHFPIPEAEWSIKFIFGGRMKDGMKCAEERDKGEMELKETKK